MVWIVGLFLLCVVVLVWLWALGVIEDHWRRHDGFTDVIENESNCSCGEECGIERGQWS